MSERPGEWAEGILEGARLIDWSSKSFDTQIVELDKSKPVLVYCYSGGRSGRAMKRMSKMDFKEVYNLSGGIRAWKSAGYPTVAK